MAAAVAATTLISPKALPFFLAGTAGWFDVLCFQQYKCYANMMSGQIHRSRQRDCHFADIPY